MSRQEIIDKSFGESLKEVPITIETAHQFFNKRQMRFIVKMFKENYRQGFLNGMKMKVITALLLLLFTSVCFSQTYVYSVKLSKTLATTAASNPTLYKQNIFELKEYKNNNDALAKGLKAGMFYCLPMVDGISLIAVVRPKELVTTGSIENTVTYLSREK